MTTVTYERENHISYITLNRPERYNALDKEMLTSLLQALEEVTDNDDQVLILTGNGKAFSAGGDISMMEGFSEKVFFDEVMEIIAEIAMKLYLMPKIVITAINGPAAGLGLSIALNADYVMASDRAKLGMLFIGIGLAPDGGGHYLLQERIGIHQAKQFIWNNKQVSSVVAKKMGLIDEIVEGNPLNTATEQGSKLYQQPIQSMIATKMLYHTSKKDIFYDHLKKEHDTQWELKQTHDHREGVDAFLNKRMPVFSGQ